jgi:hypothetical protein
MRGLAKIKFMMHEKGKMLVGGLRAERIIEEILTRAYISRWKTV